MVPAVVSCGLEAFGGSGFVASAGGDASGADADADAGGVTGGGVDAGGDVDGGAGGVADGGGAARRWEAAPNSSTEPDFARRCPFSGKPISLAQLFNGEAEIEHILPFKRTLDNSIANLTVAMRWANRLKGNRSPYEAFGSNAYKKDGIE